MAVKFEIFSILGILSWSTCSKQRMFQFLCCKMLYRGPYWPLSYFWLGPWASVQNCKMDGSHDLKFSLFWGYCVGVHELTRESSNSSVAKCYTEDLTGNCPTFDLVDEHFKWKIVRWMAVRFEIFSILGILSWSTCSKRRKFHLFCCKMVYRDPKWLLSYFQLGPWAF